MLNIRSITIMQIMVSRESAAVHPSKFSWFSGHPAGTPTDVLSASYWFSGVVHGV